MSPAGGRTPLRLATATAAGALLTLAFPPFDLWPAAIVGPMLLLWALAGLTPLAGALAGLGFGAVFMATLVWWLSNLGVIALVPVVVVEAVFFAGAGAAIASVRRWPVAARVIAIAGIWALMEALRVRVPVGGFAWGILGLGVASVAPLRWASAWIGASGWSVLLVGLAAATVTWIGAFRAGSRHDARAAARSVGVVATTIALAMLAGVAFPPIADGPTLRVAIVQGNAPCPGSTCPRERARIFEQHLALTRTLTPGAADLVVWPESSTGFATDPLLTPAVADAIGAEARRLGAYILVGSDRPVGADAFVNANVLFDPSGDVVVEYRKMHPVPFGEYVPWRPVFGGLPALAAVPRDMIRGTDPVVFDVGVGRIGSVISFESSFARYIRETVAAGAQAIVVATNEASYGISPAADQLIGITRMRAAENGVDLVHAAITGRSAFVVDGGDVRAKTDLFEPALLIGDVRLRVAGPTLYTRWGDWLQVLAVVAGSLAAMATAVEHHRRQTVLRTREEAAEATSSAGRP